MTIVVLVAAARPRDFGPAGWAAPVVAVAVALWVSARYGSSVRVGDDALEVMLLGVRLRRIPLADVLGIDEQPTRILSFRGWTLGVAKDDGSTVWLRSMACSERASLALRRRQLTEALGLASAS